MTDLRYHPVVRAYIERNPQGHFFDADTMRFFKSRLLSHVVTLASGDVVFITSEAASGPVRRRYTVRVLRSHGEIDSVAGGFQEHSTIKQALAAMNRYVKGQV